MAQYISRLYAECTSPIREVVCVCCRPSAARVLRRIRSPFTRRCAHSSASAEDFDFSRINTPTDAWAMPDLPSRSKCTQIHSCIYAFGDLMQDNIHRPYGSTNILARLIFRGQIPVAGLAERSYSCDGDWWKIDNKTSVVDTEENSGSHDVRRLVEQQLIAIHKLQITAL